MDRSLLESSLSRHGALLLNSISEKHDQKSIPKLNDDNLATQSLAQNSERLRNQSLQDPVKRFIAQKADILYCKENLHTSVRQPIFSEDDFMPPLESFMGLQNTKQQLDRFWNDVEVGDVFCCSVTAVHDSGINAVLLCHACGKERHIHHLKISAFCSIQDLPGLHSHDSPDDVYSVKDKVNAVVIGLSASPGRVHVSLCDRDLHNEYAGKIKLGLIGNEDMPQSYRMSCEKDGFSYESILNQQERFGAPDSVAAMCRQLGLSSDFRYTLVTSVRSKEIKPSEMAEALRKQQSRTHALQSVVKGVKLYKEGNQTEAAVYYNKALEVDPENLEALVARGALYANNESYRRALEDFRLALKINPKHENAIDYTVQTMMALARDLMDQGNKKAAKDVYNEVLELNPAHKVALEALSCLRQRSASGSYSEHDFSISSAIKSLDQHEEQQQNDWRLKQPVMTEQCRTKSSKKHKYKNRSDSKERSPHSRRHSSDSSRSKRKERMSANSDNLASPSDEQSSKHKSSSKRQEFEYRSSESAGHESKLDRAESRDSSRLSASFLPYGLSVDPHCIHTGHQSSESKTSGDDHHKSVSSARANKKYSKHEKRKKRKSDHRERSLDEEEKHQDHKKDLKRRMEKAKAQHDETQDRLFSQDSRTSKESREGQDDVKNSENKNREDGSGSTDVWKTQRESIRFEEKKKEKRRENQQKLQEMEDFLEMLKKKKKIA